jgi:hypothetical protein
MESGADTAVLGTGTGGKAGVETGTPVECCGIVGVEEVVGPAAKAVGMHATQDWRHQRWLIA